MKRAKILSASAGSGKTYQLTLKYICDIIESPERYQSILAVTFTNKATEEMKSRILREIHVLASGAKSSYLDNIITKMNLGEEKIRECARIARNKILHDFSRFNILTIDRFFQRILRAFIKELGLDLNYNIELDTDVLLERSADTLIESISENEDVRRWLFDFAEERFNDGDKWDLRRDLCGIGEQLFSSDGAKQMRRDISKEKLYDIVKLIVEEAERCKQHIKKLGEKAVGLMKEYGVAPEQFKGKTKSFAFCFQAYAQGELKQPTATMLKVKGDIDEWCGKDAGGNVKCAAEKLFPILGEICSKYNECVEKINTSKLVRDNYRTFALLVDLQRYISNICTEENMMILSDTKDILADFIDDNNAPFIYEKVGNRYDHYMIDEFQDTSVREWRNMLPLLREALASNDKSSVFIVGDIKQSIYRWRGGDWRLLNNAALEDLRPENTEIDNLEYNYRSLENVVLFNNKIIEQMVAYDNSYLNALLDGALKDDKISNEVYASYFDILSRAYSGHKQEVARVSEDKGYAELCAYDSKIIDSPFIEAIEYAVERGYKYRDILILVRNRIDALKVADQLFAYKERKFTLNNLSGFNILMADSLTLDGCDIVEFIIAVLRLSISADNDIDRGLYNRFLGLSLDHQLDNEELEYLTMISHLSPMEAFEDIVGHYKLYDHKDSIAYLQAMHEQIVVFATSKSADISQFLTWWSEHGNKVNVAVEMSDDTIEIMTIHKAKGLERDVVIIPYANWSINPSAINKPIVWAQAGDNNKEVAEIGKFPVIYGNNMKESAFAEDYYRELVMNHVDNINLLYVALTRASKELYIYTSANINSSRSSDNISSTAPLLVNAVTKVCPEPESVMAEGQQAALYYAYGEPLKSGVSQEKHDTVEEILLDSYMSNMPPIKVRYPAQRHIDEDAQSNSESLGVGIRLHSIFERAHTVKDLYDGIDNLLLGCIIDLSEAESLKAKIDTILVNDTVKEWFSGEWDDVKCETNIISHKGVRRPDRVMIKDDRVIVVDYKFGEKHNAVYKKQMAEYIALLRDMKCYRHIEGYVWYVALGEVDKVE